MKYRILKPFGSRSGLKIYQVGEIVDFPKGSYRTARLLNGGYVERLRYDKKLPTDIRNLLQMWIDCNENPIKEIGILHHGYYDTGDVDKDGFYCYSFRGYVSLDCNNKTGNQLAIRLKAPLSFNFEPYKDYSLEELGLKEKGVRRFRNGE